MAEPSTFIKIDRNILDWRWYQDGNTLRVFLHLLLKANIKDKDFEKITIHRGEVATSYGSIADALGLSVKNVRTAIEHLKETGEVAVNRHPKFQVISIKNYDRYQAVGSQTADNRQANGNQLAGNRQQSKNERIEESKNEINNNISSSKTNPKSEPPVWFEEVWNMYPRKRGKNQISKKSYQELEKAGYDAVRRAIEAYKREIQVQRKEEKFILYGSTFFNGRWKDYLDAPGFKEMTPAKTQEDEEFLAIFHQN